MSASKEFLKQQVIEIYTKNKNITYDELKTNSHLLKFYSSIVALRKRLFDLPVRVATFKEDLQNLVSNKNINKVLNSKSEEPIELNKKEALDMFRKQYHKKTIATDKVKIGIEKYLKKRGFIPDAEFRQLCGVSMIDWKHAKEQHSKLQVTIDGKIIWGHGSIIKDMQKIIENNATFY